MAGGSRVSVLKEFHKLLHAADKLYDGQVEFVMDEGEDKDDVTEQIVENAATEKDAEDDVTEGNTEEVDNGRFDAFFYITPNEGLYKNARIKFHMNVRLSTYPNTAPYITCLNSIYHPNIHALGDGENRSEAEICVNLLVGDWEPAVGLDGAVMAVLFLFHHPELSNPLSYTCQRSDTDLEEYEYEANVRSSLRGESVVEDYIFDKFLDDETETDTEDDEETEKGVTSNTTHPSSTSTAPTTVTSSTTTTATSTTTTTTTPTATTSTTANGAGDREECVGDAVSDENAIKVGKDIVESTAGPKTLCAETECPIEQENGTSVSGEEKTTSDSLVLPCVVL